MPGGDTNLPKKILFVDDDKGFSSPYATSLSKYSINTQIASDIESAMYMFNQNRFEVCLVELEFSGLSGLALIQKWRQHEMADKRSTGFILLAAQKRNHHADALMAELGDMLVLQKPFTDAQLVSILSKALALKKSLVTFQDFKTRILDYYNKSGDFTKAIEQVEKKKNELGDRGKHILLDLYEKSGRFEEALSLCNDLIQKHPNDLGLLNAKGRFLMKLGRYSEAIACMEKADEIAPENIERIESMAETYLELKQPDESVSKFRQLVNLTPEDPELKFKFFDQLYSHGYDDHAISFGKETAQPMEIVRHYNNKGVALSKAGNVNRALIEYQRALNYYPKFRENYRILFNIALAHLNTKDRKSYELAEKNLIACLELKKDFDKAKNTLEQVQKALQKKQAS